MRVESCLCAVDWAIEFLLGSKYRAAPAAQDPREHVSAGVGAGPGACSQVGDVCPARQASPDERRCDLDLAGVVLDGPGTGFEAGAGMRYAAEGIAIEGTVRKLVTHEDSGYEEWGASGSVRIDSGASGRGVSLTLAPAFGAASSETERLWSLGDAGRLSGDPGVDVGSRLEAEVGYGWRLLSTTHGMLTPYTGVSFSDSSTRAWRLGARLMMTRDVSFGLEGTHRERNDDASDQAVILHSRLHW